MRGFLLLLGLVAFLAIPAMIIPDWTPESSGGGMEIKPAPFLAMFGFGFLLAIGGHIYKSNFAIVFLSLVLVPVALYATGT